MLNRYNVHTKKLIRVYVPPKVVNTDITGSLEGVIQPTKKTTIVTKKDTFSNTQIVNTKVIPNTNITASLQSIEVPSTIEYAAYTKVAPTISKITNNKNTTNDFQNEIIEFSGMKIEKQPNEVNIINKKLIIYNTSLEYGTTGVKPENIEIYLNGLIISPSIYYLEQVGVNIEIVFVEEFLDFNGLEKENIIIIGKFSDIGLELEEIDDVGLSDENGEQLII
jgi:hypothetical protein